MFSYVSLEPFEVYINSVCVFSMRQLRRYPTSDDLNMVSIVNCFRVYQLFYYERKVYCVLKSFS